MPTTFLLIADSLQKYDDCVVWLVDFHSHLHKFLVIGELSDDVFGWNNFDELLVVIRIGPVDV